MTFNVSASIDQTVQIGQEASPGTGTAANRRMQSLTIDFGDEVTNKAYRPQGHRHTNVVEEEMAWSSFTVAGEPDYREILYALENIFGPATPTLVPSTTTTYQRIYTIPLTGKMTPKTWIAQWGDANNVNQIVYGLLCDFGMKFDIEASPQYSGLTGIAQIKTTGATFTAAPTVDSLAPIVRTHLNYYVDSTGAGLGTTQITDEFLNAEITYKGMYGPRWASNRSYQSFAGHVDLVPKTDFKFLLAEGTFARSLVVGQTYFVRLDLTSTQTTETGHFFELKIDFAIKPNKPGKYSDNKGVYAHEFDSELVEDTTWGNALVITSITDLATI